VAVGLTPIAVYGQMADPEFGPPVPVPEGQMSKLIPNINQCSTIDRIIDNNCMVLTTVFAEENGVTVAPGGICLEYQDTINEIVPSVCSVELINPALLMNICPIAYDTIDEIVLHMCLVQLIPSNTLICPIQYDTIDEIVMHMCLVELIPVNQMICAIQYDTINEIVMQMCLVQLIPVNQAICGPEVDTINEIVMSQCLVELIIPGANMICPPEVDTINEIVSMMCLVELIISVDCNKLDTINDLVIYQCLIELIKPGDQMMCKPCVGPVRIDGDTTGKPKKLCNGQLSFATVHGQRCKDTAMGGSSCMLGGEGFTFCPTTYLWYRYGVWTDWDVCSLCLEEDLNKPLTGYGRYCEGICDNTHNNREMEAPRCKVVGGAPNELDYCTTCTGSCANPAVDFRPGNEVKPFFFGEATAAAGK